MIQKQVEYEISKLNQLTSHINKELKSLPSETIHEERNGPYYRYYLRQNGQKHYLHKKDHEYILALASRKYLTNELASLQMQLSFLSDYLLTITNDLPTNTISNPKLLANLTKTSTYNLNDSALAWQNASYESNPRHP